MADREIDLLPAAEQITLEDLFLMKQGGVAKKLPGRILIAFLTALADGHGGIHGIEKTGTEGLVDTYRITLADGTPFEYTVTNGEKGDKGDNAYTWIKYASQEPTADSHSMGDAPDRWMGVYAGNLAAAPDDWTLYKWFEIKGQKGDTGDPAVLQSAPVMYQVSASGSEIPTGEWTAAVPDVPQGGYLWSRIVYTFNTGDPVTVYSVSRVGIDGLGTLRTINGIAPDENGNINLTAANVGALARTGDTFQGLMNVNGHRLTGLPSPVEDSDAVHYALVKDLRQLMWSNIKYDNEFAAQTLSVYTTGYYTSRTAIAVIGFHASTTDRTMIMSPPLLFGTTACTYQIPVLYTAGGVSIKPLTRNVTIQRRSEAMVTIMFDDAYLNGQAVSNEYLIPFEIYFIREVT